VRQHDPHANRWNDISFYNESGNFLGPAIFNTKQGAQEYFNTIVLVMVRKKRKGKVRLIKEFSY
jgi:hypothetical protein